MGNSVTFSSDIAVTTATMKPVTRNIPPVLAHTFKVIAVLMAAFVAYQSLAPTNAPGSIHHLDKFLHAAVYCVLTFFVAGGWRYSTLIFVFVVTSAFGACLEVAQGMMGLGRSASFADQLANMFGAGLACGVWIMVVKLFRRRRV